MTLLTEADFPQVRAAIDLALDAEELPDEVIAYPIFLEAAEDDVFDIDPVVATRTGSALRYARRAAIYFTAARLVDSIPDLTGETFGTYIYKRTATDRTRQAAVLRGKALDALASYLGGILLDRPPVLAAAPGYRGRFGTHGTLAGQGLGPWELD